MTAENAPGVLIFYAYANLRGTAGDAVESQLREAASALHLRGRVRVADDGVNAAVGGSIASLRCFSATVRAQPELDGVAIDFQLSGAPEQPAPQQRAASAFDSFQLRRSAELVTLGPAVPSFFALEPAQHVSPADFHALLATPAAGTVLLLSLIHI
jgi:predicted sulfurtransferase